jgi:hypothetical protein
VPLQANSVSIQFPLDNRNFQEGENKERQSKYELLHVKVRQGSYNLYYNFLRTMKVHMGNFASGSVLPNREAVSARNDCL